MCLAAQVWQGGLLCVVEWNGEVAMVSVAGRTVLKERGQRQPAFLSAPPLSALPLPPSNSLATQPALPASSFERSASRVADTFASQPAPVATDVAVQTQRLTLDVVGLTAFSHDFQECDAIVRWGCGWGRVGG